MFGSIRVMKALQLDPAAAESTDPVAPHRVVGRAKVDATFEANDGARHSVRQERAHFAPSEVRRPGETVTATPETLGLESPPGSRTHESSPEERIQASRHRLRVRRVTAPAHFAVPRQARPGARPSSASPPALAVRSPGSPRSSGHRAIVLASSRFRDRY